MMNHFKPSDWNNHHLLFLEILGVGRAIPLQVLSGITCETSLSWKVRDSLTQVSGSWGRLLARAPSLPEASHPPVGWPELLCGTAISRFQESKRGSCGGSQCLGSGTPTEARASPARFREMVPTSCWEKRITLHSISELLLNFQKPILIAWNNSF